MIRDKVIFGGIVGFLANLAMNVFQYPMWRLGIVKHPLSHYAGSLFLDFNTLHHTFYGAVVAWTVDILYSVLWGILFVYLMDWTGRRHFMIKGILFGALIWLVSFGGIRTFPMVTLREYLPVQALYYLFFHLVFGFVLGVLVARWKGVYEMD